MLQLEVNLFKGSRRKLLERLDIFDIHFFQLGHDKIVQLLFRYGANVNTENNVKSTPLHEAVSAGHTNVVKLLLNEGASFKAENIESQTPLDIARTKGIKANKNKWISWKIQIPYKFNASNAKMHLNIAIFLYEDFKEIIKILENVSELRPAVLGK